MDPMLMAAAMIRAGGDVWVKQIRVATVLTEATLRQTRVFWGLSHPGTVVSICTPSGRPAPSRPRRKSVPPETENVPV